MSKHQTLDAPVFEVKQDSKWYKDEAQRRADSDEFFKHLEEEYGMSKGFGYYHSEYFGIQFGTEEYEKYKGELVKNCDKNGFHAFKKRSKYFKEISKLLEKVERRSPFKAHDVLGMNNMTGSQWIGGRWFYGVKDETQVKGDEVKPIEYKEYLKVVMETLD